MMMSMYGGTRGHAHFLRSNLIKMLSYFTMFALEDLRRHCDPSEPSRLESMEALWGEGV